MNFNYKYDLSNCLLETENDNAQQKEDFKLANKYDKDGYITVLKRYDGSGSLKDNFIYTFYSGTNKLQRVYGSSPLYTYDANCNMLTDEVNRNRDIKYDHRNLITQFYHTDREAVSRPYTYATRYYYDESGGRVRKLEYFNTQTNPPLITDWDNPGNGWLLYNNEFYVKGADGKDLATYQGSELEDWYVWGNDLAGKIRKDKPYYYFKDHLGSVRAIVNESAEIVAAYDGACPPWRDAWGYPLEGRTYNADTIKFKYTGKELDKESLYDYFGARYYDSRIGRWGQAEPLLEKYLSSTPYSYSINNPLSYIDLNGQDAIGQIDEENKRIRISMNIYYSTNSRFKGYFNQTKSNKLKEYISEAQTAWNIAGVKMEYKGIDYTVEFIVNLIEGNYSNSNLTELQKIDGNNIAVSDQYFVNDEGENMENVPAGVAGNILTIYNAEGRTGTGSHELGHLMGIEHPPGVNDPGNRDLYIDLMSFGKYREGPRSWNVRQVIDKLDFRTSDNQLIKGALK